MTRLSTVDLWRIVRQAGAIPGADRVAVAAALVESGGDPDAVGDNGCSFGLWQINVCGGLGTGHIPANLRDPTYAASLIVPLFNHYWQQWSERSDEIRAALTYMWTERPLGFNAGDEQATLRSAAAQRFVAQWRSLDDADTSERAERALAQARQWIGVPYRLAPDATTRDGADCSGFVIGVFRELGWPFASGIRTAEQIRLACDVVTNTDNWDNSAVRRGDLLFFERTGGENPGERAGHVGFALLGRQMLDANNVRGTVGITDISSAWWQERLFEVRRPPQYHSDAPPADPCADLASWYGYTTHDIPIALDLAVARGRQLSQQLAVAKNVREVRKLLQDVAASWDAVEAVANTLRRGGEPAWRAAKQRDG